MSDKSREWSYLNGEIILLMQVAEFLRDATRLPYYEIAKDVNNKFAAMADRQNVNGLLYPIIKDTKTTAAGRFTFCVPDMSGHALKLHAAAFRSGNGYISIADFITI